VLSFFWLDSIINKDHFAVYINSKAVFFLRKIEGQFCDGKGVILPLSLLFKVWIKSFYKTAYCIGPRPVQVIHKCRDHSTGNCHSYIDFFSSHKSHHNRLLPLTYRQDNQISKHDPFNKALLYCSLFLNSDYSFTGFFPSASLTKL